VAGVYPIPRWRRIVDGSDCYQTQSPTSCTALFLHIASNKMQKWRNIVEELLPLCMFPKKTSTVANLHIRKFSSITGPRSQLQVICQIKIKAVEQLQIFNLIIISLIKGFTVAFQTFLLKWIITDWLCYVYCILDRCNVEHWNFCIATYKTSLKIKALYWFLAMVNACCALLLRPRSPYPIKNRNNL